MRVGTAEARERFKELLDRVQAGETVEIARRGKVLAVLSTPPDAGRASTFSETVNAVAGDVGRGVLGRTRTSFAARPGSRSAGP